MDVCRVCFAMSDLLSRVCLLPACFHKTLFLLMRETCSQGANVGPHLVIPCAQVLGGRHALGCS